MAITAALVKELRERTGAGMMDCKKALIETSADLEAAIDLMRASGAAKAAKKAGRVASEGLVSIAVSDDNKSAAILEVNSETDFVAKSGAFIDFVSKLVKLALKNMPSNIEEFLSQTLDTGETVDKARENIVAKIGENISIRRVKVVKTGNGTIGAYKHGGRIAVLTHLAEDNAPLAKDIAMHIAAANPQALDPSTVDASDLERERAVLLEQAKESGKPADIAEKMVEGRIRKYYEEVCLTEQTFIMDGENKVSQVIENAAKEMGSPIKLTGYIRFALGEGIEKEEEDFAAEVAKTARSA